MVKPSNVKFRRFQWTNVLQEGCPLCSLHCDPPIQFFRVTATGPIIMVPPLYAAFFTARCADGLYAKRGNAIACRLHVCLSVCPSVTLVDCDHIGIGWKSVKLIAGTISPTPSLFVAQRPPTYTPSVTWGNFWETRARWGGKKWRAGAQKQQYL